MAKANWVATNPPSGSGNGTVAVSSHNEHTGRVARSTVITFKAANTNDEPRTVNQAGKPEYVDIADAAASSKEGKVVTISGESNSAKLSFRLGTGSLDVELPRTYTANSVFVSNGAAIPGDPGASAVYPFSIAITVPANSGTSEVSRQIIVSDEAGHEDVCLLTLAAGEPYIIIEADVIELDYKGTPVTVEVKSNTTWTVE